MHLHPIEKNLWVVSDEHQVLAHIEYLPLRNVFELTRIGDHHEPLTITEHKTLNDAVRSVG